MVYNKTTIRWDWPLISLEWIPDILKDFDYMYEPSWSGLYNLLTRELDYQIFAKRTFYQIKRFLLEFSIVEEQGKYLFPKIKSDEEALKTHLNMIVKSLSEPWHNLFESLSTTKSSLCFQDIKNQPPSEWKIISNYAIFKQWASLYQYIDLGILVNKYQFYPITYFENDNDSRNELIENCFFYHGDPRILTYKFSTHTLADSLALHKGEVYLPFTNESKSSTKYEFISVPLNINNNSASKNIIKDIQFSISDWKRNIISELNSNNIENVQKLIQASKYLIDFFLFGELNISDDHIDYNCLMQVKNMWESESSHKLSDRFWETLSKYYRDITRLYWGERFYNNYLVKRVDEIEFESNLIINKNFPAYKKLPIRSLKSKRTLKSIFDNNYIINKKINNLINKNLISVYKTKAQKLSYYLCDYLPPDAIERKYIINKLYKMNMISEMECILLSSDYEKTNISEIPKNEILQQAYWLHYYNRLNKNPIIKTIETIDSRLQIRINQLYSSIEYYNNQSDDTLNLCEKIRLELIKREN